MKKKYLILLVLLMLPLFLMAQTSSCLGDVNRNGVIDIIDALVIAQASVGLNPVNYFAECADMNCNGSIEIIDALIIAQYYVGIITSFPCQSTPVPTAAPTPSGNPYQRGPDPSLASISANRGTFATAELTFPAGNGFGGGFIYYPTTTSLGTWAAVAICPGGSAKFANEETWMGHWLASFGFVVIGMETNYVYDYPESRGTQLLAALDYLTQKSAVKDRVDPNRLMVMGHSMGGGGAFHAALGRSSLKTMVALAPWFNSSLTPPSLTNLRMPAMVISARNDTVVTPASCSNLYDKIPTTTQRAWVELAADDHLGFIKSNPTEMRVLIPWMKIFLDKDTRYVQFLCPMANSSNISIYKNSCPLVP